jgi:hypothetical protein
LPLVAGYTDTSATSLKEMVNGTKDLKLGNLQAASSNDVLITASIINAIKDLPLTEQSIVTGKLASEVGVSKTLEAAVYLRRMLLAGKREPNIVKTAAVNHIDDVIKELDRDVDEILFEKRMHQEFVSNTALALLENARQHQNRGKVQQREANYDLNPVEDGAVK